MVRRGWSEARIRKALGENRLRCPGEVWGEVFASDLMTSTATSREPNAVGVPLAMTDSLKCRTISLGMPPENIVKSE